jgi:hypothetical protein
MSACCRSAVHLDDGLDSAMFLNIDLPLKHERISYCSYVETLGSSFVAEHTYFRSAGDPPDARQPRFSGLLTDLCRTTDNSTTVLGAKTRPTVLR